MSPRRRRAAGSGQEHRRRTLCHGWCTQPPRARATIALALSATCGMQRRAEGATAPNRGGAPCQRAARATLQHSATNKDSINKSTDGGDGKRPRADWPTSDTGAVEGRSAPQIGACLGRSRAPQHIHCLVASSSHGYSSATPLLTLGQCQPNTLSTSLPPRHCPTL